MVIFIYNMEHKSTGNHPGREFLAKVELAGGSVKIECYELNLKKKLEEIFSTPLIRMSPLVSKTSVLSHRMEAVHPFTEDFFEEIIFNLHCFDLHGVIQK